MFPLNFYTIFQTWLIGVWWFILVLWLQQEVLLFCFSSFLTFTSNAYKVAKWSIVGCLLNSSLFLRWFWVFFLRKLQHNHRQTMVYLNAIMCCRLWICFFSYMYLKIKFSQHLRKKGSEIFQIIVFSFLHDCL